MRVEEKRETQRETVNKTWRKKENKVQQSEGERDKVAEK